jgi:hypothetical protein
MICEEFEKLTPKEKTEFIGKVVHAIQSSTKLYLMGKEIIGLGEIQGLFEGVKILPRDTKDV